MCARPWIRGLHSFKKGHYYRSEVFIFSRTERGVCAKSTTCLECLTPIRWHAEWMTTIYYGDELAERCAVGHLNGPNNELAIRTMIIIHNSIPWHFSYRHWTPSFHPEKLHRKYFNAMTILNMSPSKNPLRKHKSRAQLLLSTPLNRALCLPATCSLALYSIQLSHSRHTCLCKHMHSTTKSNGMGFNCTERLQLLSESAMLFWCRCHIQKCHSQIRKLEVRSDNKWIASYHIIWTWALNNNRNQAQPRKPHYLIFYAKNVTHIQGFSKHSNTMVGHCCCCCNPRSASLCSSYPLSTKHTHTTNSNAAAKLDIQLVATMIHRVENSNNVYRNYTFNSITTSLCHRLPFTRPPLHLQRRRYYCKLSFHFHRLVCERAAATNILKAINYSILTWTWHTKSHFHIAVVPRRFQFALASIFLPFSSFRHGWNISKIKCARMKIGSGGVYFHLKPP